MTAENIQSRFWWRWKAAELSKLRGRIRLRWPEGMLWSCLRRSANFRCVRSGRSSFSRHLCPASGFPSPRRGCREDFRFEISDCRLSDGFSILKSKICNLQFLNRGQDELPSRDSRRRPRHALLAAEPAAAGQATAGARWQAEHDPANGRKAVAPGFGGAFLGHHQPAFTARDHAPASAAEPEKHPGRTGGAQHGTRHWPGCVHADEIRSGCCDWIVSVRPRHC